jgi:hypothetical protein
VPLPLDRRVAVPEGVLFQELDGEAVLLDLATETYYGLDDVGTRMLRVVTSAPTLDDGIASLAAEYDVPAETLRRDVLALVTSMVERGLLELDRA